MDPPPRWGGHGCFFPENRSPAPIELATLERPSSRTKIKIPAALAEALGKEGSNISPARLATVAMYSMVYRGRYAKAEVAYSVAQELQRRRTSGRYPISESVMTSCSSGFEPEQNRIGRTDVMRSRSPTVSKCFETQTEALNLASTSAVGYSFTSMASNPLGTCSMRSRAR